MTGISFIPQRQGTQLMHPRQTNLMTQMLACGTILLASVIASGCESAPQYADTSAANDSSTPAIVDDDELSPSIDDEKRTTVTCNALPFDSQGFAMRVETPGSARSTFNVTEPACPHPPCAIEPSIEVVGGGFTVRFTMARASVGKLDKPMLKVTGLSRGHGIQSVTRVIDTPLQFEWNEAGDMLTLKVTETDLETVTSAALSWVADERNANVANLPPWNVDLLWPLNGEIPGGTSSTNDPEDMSGASGKTPPSDWGPHTVCCEYDCQCIGGIVSCVCIQSAPSTGECV